MAQSGAGRRFLLRVRLPGSARARSGAQDLDDAVGREEHHRDPGERAGVREQRRPLEHRRVPVPVLLDDDVERRTARAARAGTSMTTGRRRGRTTIANTTTADEHADPRRHDERAEEPGRQRARANGCASPVAPFGTRARPSPSRGRRRRRPGAACVAAVITRSAPRPREDDDREAARARRAATARSRPTPAVAASTRTRRRTSPTPAG